MPEVEEKQLALDELGDEAEAFDEAFGAPEDEGEGEEQETTEDSEDEDGEGEETGVVSDDDESDEPDTDEDTSDDEPDGGDGDDGRAGDAESEKPKTFEVDGYEYDQDTLKFAINAATQFQEIDKSFVDDPVKFIQSLTGAEAFKSNSDYNAKALAAYFAEQAGMNLINEDGDYYEHKEDESLKTKSQLEKVEQENQQLKARVQQSEMQTELNEALAEMKLSYTDSDKNKLTHPVNIALRLHKEQNGQVSIKQALRRVLSEMNSSQKNEEVKVKKKKKTAPPTPPPADEDPYSMGAEFEQWLLDNGE